MAICQADVTLDNSSQNALVQKITNIVSAGDDNVSYKKSIEKLNKKLLEEVGTARTSGRPINVVESEIKEIESEINELELYKIKFQNVDYQNDIAKKDLKLIETKINMLKDIKEQKKQEQLAEQRIGINTQKLNEYNNKLKELKNSSVNRENTNKGAINPLIVLVISAFFTICSIAIKNIAVTIGVGAIAIIISVITLMKYNKQKKIISKENEKNIKANKEMEIIEDSIKQYTKEIETDRQKIEEKQNEQKRYILEKYGATNGLEQYVFEEIDIIENEIEKNQNKYNELMLSENSLNIEKSNIYEKLETLVNKEERLQYLYEQQETLKKLANAITYAEEGLEEAYKQVKNTITPKFTNKLADVIKTVTNKKYNKVSFSDEFGLTVELENGEYINCNRLSIGTIDQMYLALRLSILDEISKEKMPIILDEAFAYYDELRLENMLKYLVQNEDRQIIIFTCTNREQICLSNANIGYNLINL